MGKVTLLAAFVLAAALAPSALGATVSVAITRAGFVPDPANVQLGDTVVWTNQDTQPRQVVSSAAGFASPVLQPAQQFSFTFARAGRFSYEDPLVRPRQRGTVSVTSPAGSITIAASRRIVVYGLAARLSGALSTRAAGERLTVQVRACGGTFTRVGDVTTGEGGVWSLDVKPINNSVYRVQWRNVSSPELEVFVRPRLRLSRVAPQRFTLRIHAAARFGGKTAVFQRFVAATRTWARVRFFVLRDTQLGIDPTRISTATYVSRIPGRLRVRVVLPQGQVGSCYRPGISNVILS